MATVLDTFIIEIGLDPKKLTSGQKDALKKFSEFKDKAKKEAQELEKQAKAQEAAVGRVTTAVLSMVGVLVGAASVGAFIANVVKTDNALGRMADQTDQTVGSLSLVGNMVSRVGGNMDAARASAANLSREIARFQATGQSSIVQGASYFGVNLIGPDGKPTDVTKLYDDLNKAVQGRDKNRSSYILSTMGLDEGSIQLIEQNRAAFLHLRDSAKAAGNITDADRASADQLTAAWSQLGQQASTTGRDIITTLTPALIFAFKAASNYMALLRSPDPKVWTHVMAGTAPGKNFHGNAFQALYAWVSGNYFDKPAARVTGHLGASAGGTLAKAMGITPSEMNAYRQGTANIESAGGNYGAVGGSSGRFSGAYQLGATEIADAARMLGEAVPTRAKFLADARMQERYFDAYTLSHYQYLMKKSAKFRALSHHQQLALLGYAHNQGAGGAVRYLESGRAGHDAFGTSGTRYIDSIKAALDGLPQSAGQRGGSSPVTIHNMTINTQAKEAHGVARDIHGALNRQALANQANSGPS